MKFQDKNIQGSVYTAILIVDYLIVIGVQKRDKMVKKQKKNPTYHQHESKYQGIRNQQKFTVNHRR